MHLSFLDRLSVRVKLLILFVVLTCVAATPIIYLNYKDALKNAQKVALLEFHNQLQVARDSIQLGYIYTQWHTNSRGVFLREVADYYINAFMSLDKKGDKQAIEYHRRLAEAFGYSYALYSTRNGKGEWIYQSDAIDNLIKLNPLDPRGYYFRDFFSKPYTLPYGTRYDGLVYQDDGAAGKTPYFYVLFRTKTDTYVFLVDISLLQFRAKEQFKQISVSAKDMLLGFETLSPEQLFTVYDKDSRTIASRGAASQNFRLPEDLKVHVQKYGEFYGVREGASEEWLYGAVHIKGLNWYAVSAMPTSALMAPVRKHILTILGVAIVLSAGVCILGLLYIMHTLKPLEQLSRSASDFSKLDFSADDLAQKATAIVERIPNQYEDEIGQVGKAFGKMVTTIEENVTLLKQTLSMQQHIEGELRAAHDIQMQILPVEKDGFSAKHFSARALIVPAREVGGDFFDVMQTPDGRQALIIGDVSGKGVSAALFMCVTLTLIRNAITSGLSAAASMDAVNKVLAIKNSTCMFATLWIGLFDPKTGRLTFSNGGHCPPAIISKAGDLRWIRDVSGPLVGVIDEAEFNECETTLEKGDLCLLYTDGVSEAMNSEKELFGEERIAKTMESLAGKDPKETLTAFIEAIKAHRGEYVQSDDITMLAFRYEETRA